MSRPLLKSENELTHKKDWKSFQEWSDKGFYITKGSKSIRRNEDGICLFHKGQVYKETIYQKPYTSENNKEYYLDDEDSWELSSMMGLSGYEGPGFW